MRIKWGACAPSDPTEMMHVCLFYLAVESHASSL